MSFKTFKRDFHFSKKEKYSFAIVSFLTGLILSFRMWGDNQLDLNQGIESLITMVVLSFMALLIHFSAQKIYCIRKGIKCEYKLNPYALGIGTYLTLLFNGVLFLVSPGYMQVNTLRDKRVGKFRYRAIFKEYTYMCNMGILANLFFAGIVSGLSSNIFVFNFMKVNVIIALFSLIPYPRNNGIHMINGSIYQSIFMSIFTVVFSLMIFYASFWLTVLVSLAFGVWGMYSFFDQ